MEMNNQLHAPVALLHKNEPVQSGEWSKRNVLGPASNRTRYLVAHSQMRLLPTYPGQG